MPNIKLTATAKKQMLEKLANGATVVELAKEYSVSQRTVNRLIQTTRNDALANSEPSVPLKGAATFNLDRPTTQDLFLRLLGLSQTAMAVTEEILLNPDSSDLNRLKAASLIAQWTGLQPRPFGSMSLCRGVHMMETWQADFEAGRTRQRDQPH